MALVLALQGFATEVAQSVLSDPQFSGMALETVDIPAREHEKKNTGLNQVYHIREKRHCSKKTDSHVK